jgi:TonB family protein
LLAGVLLAAPTVTPPERIDAVEAVRPAGVDPALEVEVVLALVIDANGVVQEIEVLESGGTPFDQAAIEAARAFRFTPAREGDTPIPVEIEFVYVFEPVPPPVEVSAGIDEVETVQLVVELVDATRVSLDGEEAERIAGSQGDAIKSAQVLGGVGRPSLGTGELVLWGASPSDTRRQVDWILVPRLFHLGGGRSIVPSPRVGSVSVVPGGFGVAYGRAIGGLVMVETADPPERSERMGAFARVDPIDVGAGVDTFAGERGHLSLAARRSVLTQTFGRVAPTSTREVVPLPESWDYQARADVELRSDLTLQVLGLGAEDRVTRSLPARTEDVAFTERAFAGFHRLGARLAWTGSDGRAAEVAAWFGVDRDRTRQDFTTVAVAAGADTWRGGVRLAQQRPLKPWLELRWGVDAELARAVLERDGALTLPAREGDVTVFGQPPGDRVGSDAWRSTQGSIAAHVTTAFSWGEGRWRFEPGVRVEPMVQTGDRILPVRPIEPEVGYADVEVVLLPRGQLVWSPVERIRTFVAGGRYAQAPDAADLSPIFGNPRLTPARADHAVLGTEVAPASWMSLGATGFFIRSRDRTGRAPEPTPPTAGLLRSEGRGRSFGGQFVVAAQPVESVDARLVYAWTRSERGDPGASMWRRSDFDQPHLLTAVVGWRHRTGVSVGGRATMTSGFPRTAVVDAVPNARAALWDPIFGEHNAQRLPTFFELSLRTAYAYTWSTGAMSVWLDVQNVTHRGNAFEFFYSVDYQQRGLVRGLPILPLLGVEVRT